MAILPPGAVKTRFVINKANLDVILSSIDGPVGTMLSARATRVQIAAKKQVDRGAGSPFSLGSRTGKLRDSIVKRPAVLIGGELTVQVGTDLYYAAWVHNGNGPPGSRIYPKPPGKVLAFPWRGGTIVVRSVKASKPNPFLTDNLKLAVL